MNMRLKKVLDDIQKTENKILELQEHVRQLRIQKKQMEDAEIIKAIRSMKMDSRKMLTFLDGIQNGTVTMQFDEEGNLSMDSSETGIKKEENMDREMSTGLIEEREDLEDENILMIMLSSTILMGSASVTAFAQANENAEQTETAEQVIEEQPAEQPATEGTPFSTPGNGQLVDDKENDSSKQFLTVQTKNGNTFYMVIDRSGTSENVYMMSLVDEQDLAEFLDENEETEKKEESAVVLPEITTTPEPETTVQPETEVKPESGGNKMFGSAVLGGGIVLVFGGLAAFALSKFRKKKEDGIVEEGLEFADDSYINEDEENAEDQQK